MPAKIIEKHIERTELSDLALKTPVDDPAIRQKIQEIVNHLVTSV